MKLWRIKSTSQLKWWIKRNKLWNRMRGYSAGIARRYKLCDRWGRHSRPLLELLINNLTFCNTSFMACQCTFSAMGVLFSQKPLTVQCTEFLKRECNYNTWSYYYFKYMVEIIDFAWTLAHFRMVKVLVCRHVEVYICSIAWGKGLNIGPWGSGLSQQLFCKKKK